MDNNSEKLTSTETSRVSLKERKLSQPDIVGRLETLEGVFLGALQQIRQIKSELSKRVADSGTLEPLMDAEKVAVILGVDIKQVYALARKKHIPSIRVGPRYVKFSPVQLKRFFDNKSDC